MTLSGRGSGSGGSRRKPGDLDLFGASDRAPTFGRNDPRLEMRPRTVLRPNVRPDAPADTGMSPATAVSVHALTSLTRDLLEGSVQPLWIRGEVTGFKRHRNGHWYFALRDAAAQVKCVVWSRDQRSIPAPPDDGMQVMVYGQPTLFALRGEFQITVTAMEASGDGLWRKKLEQARARLQAEGLLAPDRKRALPRFPKRVAVVTSLDGAALHDIVAVVRRRCPIVDVVVVPARVQGEEAVLELTAAIERVSRWGRADIVIVGRGGGAREDLWAFNDERVARALALCTVPTISAVGHEIDTTLCDLVADHRAPTPSAAAEAAVPVLDEARAAVAACTQALRAAFTRRLTQGALRLERAGEQLRGGALRSIERRRGQLEAAGGRLDALSPLRTLSRGYAVARDGSGRTMPDVGSFARGGVFELLLRDGRVDASVVDVHSDGAPHDQRRS